MVPVALPLSQVHSSNFNCANPNLKLCLTFQKGKIVHDRYTNRRSLSTIFRRKIGRFNQQARVRVVTIAQFAPKKW